MSQILFKNEADISSDWLFYIENEAKALAQREDFAIQNYVDREIFNPEVQKFLDSDAMEALLKDISGGKPLHLGLAEERKARFLPDWLRPIVGWLMPRVGPRGLEFARARVEMKAVETVLHLRRAHPRRLRSMVPAHIWALLAPYGIKPAADERSRNERGPAA